MLETITWNTLFNSNKVPLLIFRIDFKIALLLCVAMSGEKVNSLANAIALLDLPNTCSSGGKRTISKHRQSETSPNPHGNQYVALENLLFSRIELITQPPNPPTQIMTFRGRKVREKRQSQQTSCCNPFSLFPSPLSS